MADQERLAVRPNHVEPIRTSRDIVDVVRHAMEALQPVPTYPSNDTQLVFDELASVLEFFGVDV